MPHNIDDFNRGCALILAHLYAHFPVPVLLKMRELDSCADLLPEEHQRRDARFLVYGATVEFLRDEGFISTGNDAGAKEDRTFARARLTSKGLAALLKLPAQLDPSRKTSGEVLIDAVKDMSTQAIRDAIAAALRSVFGA